MDKDKEEALKCISMDEGSETGSKSVAIISSPGSIHTFLIVNTEAWDRVMQNFRDLGKAVDAGLEAVKPLMRDAARAQSDALAQFRRECLGEWIQPENQVFTLEALREYQEKCQMESLRQTEERSIRMAQRDNDSIVELFRGTSLSFSIQNEPVKTLQELCEEVRAEGFFPELQAQIDLAQKEQVQLHKKKGKKVKNWEHNKFWHGRK